MDERHLAALRDLVGAGADTPVLEWSARVPLVRDPQSDLHEALFVLRPSEDWRTLGRELLHLGCFEMDVRRVRDRDVLRAHAPSAYTVFGCLARGVDVLVRQVPRVWVPYGWRHPLAAHWEIPVDTEVWLTEPWTTLSTEDWQDALARVDLAVPQGVRDVASVAPAHLVVPLRLVRGRSLPPRLWRVEVDALERMVWTLPEEDLHAFEFAMLARGDALVRARPGCRGIVEGQAFAEHPVVAGLFVPEGFHVDPPLRHDTARRLLALEGDTIGWVVPSAGGIAIERVARGAFHPLADWVLYTADRERDAVEAWIGSAIFTWTPPPLHEAPASPSAPAPVVARRGPVQGAAAAAAPPPTVPDEPVAKVELPVVALPLPMVVPPARSDAREHLVALQELWRRERRADLWADMARAHQALGQPYEALLCWSRAVWDAGDAGGGVVAAWVQATGAHTLPQGNEPDDLLVGCGRILDGHGGPEAVAWLSARQSALDVRTRWMCHHALLAPAGDTLGLLRARDGVLAALRTGFVLARDVPGFLRARTEPAARTLLEESLAWQHHAVGAHAPEGLARPWTVAHARVCLTWVRVVLGLEPLEVVRPPGEDALHRAIVALFDARIQQARLGLPVEAPLPPEVQDRLDRLDRLDTFKLARLRESSVVLGAPGSADPFVAWASAGVPDHTSTMGAQDVARLLKEPPSAVGLRQVLVAVAALPPGQAAALLSDAVRHAEGLDDLEAAPLLEELVAIAAGAGAGDVAAAALPKLARGVAAVVATNDTRRLEAVVRDLPRNLVRLRLGLRGVELFEAATRAVPPRGTVAGMLLAGARAQCGGPFGGALDAVTAALRQALPPTERIVLACTAARVAAAAPLDEAVAHWRALTEFGASMTDSYSTKSHFALGFLRLVDAIAAGHAHPDRVLSREARDELEADEARVRARIHKESQR